MRALKRRRIGRRQIGIGVIAAGLCVVIVGSMTSANAEANGVGHGYYYGSLMLESAQDNDTGVYELTDATRGGQAAYDAVNYRDVCRDAPCDSNPPPRVFTDDDNDWGDLAVGNRQTVAVDAYYAAAKAWDYFAEVHGRHGIADDGRGLALYTSMYKYLDYEDFGNGQTARMGPAYCNCMYINGVPLGPPPYNFGPATTLDDIGAAYGRGVVQHSAGLTGTPEGHGLAMATGHIFGTMIEFYANNPKDTPDYNLGELQDRGNCCPSHLWDLGSELNEASSAGRSI